MKNNYIGENIRTYRVRANLTQQQLADKVGVSWEMISRYERQESSPLKKLENLSDALNVSKTQLLEKHIPQKYSYIDYKVPLFLNTPYLNRYIPNQANHYYVCPEWIVKRDKKCIAIDTSLISCEIENFKRDGVVYISTGIIPNREDLVLLKENNNLIVGKYKEYINSNILGKVLAQEIRY